jgi:2-polyprenyl-3-methyl-5-hydroxy-6-metoxy-1,4-benzoquinol methylase
MSEEATIDRRFDNAEYFILQNPAAAICIERIIQSSGIVRGGPIRAKEIETIAGDAFVRKALSSTLIRGPELELLLVHLRKALRRMPRQSVSDDILKLFCALAQQCFINEYVYRIDDDEMRQIADESALILRQMDDGSAIDPVMLATVGAYQPLHSLPGAVRLLERKWPPAVIELLNQQIAEPLQDRRNQGSIPAITAIDKRSLPVKQQYEENPYPRWTLSRPLPMGVVPFDTDILIVGCGTGRQSCEIAQVNPKARILAIDVSVVSLAYARRKTRELGLRNIEYAQADVLKLGSIGRQFDHIEAIGVLHHVADPSMGWRILLSLLRNGGTMRIGLYSETARRVIVDAHAIIARDGYPPTPEGIRAIRQTMMLDQYRWKVILATRDFYCMSGCRDLLFHAMEYRFDIPQMAAFMKEQNLQFLGFELSVDVIQRFLQRYPGRLLDLDCWHAFELDNPATFRSMYQFVVRK